MLLVEWRFRPGGLAKRWGWKGSIPPTAGKPRSVVDACIMIVLFINPPELAWNNGEASENGDLISCVYLS